MVCPCTHNYTDKVDGGDGLEIVQPRRGKAQARPAYATGRKGALSYRDRRNNRVSKRRALIPMRADELELELIVHEGNPMGEGDGMCEHVCQSDDYKKKDANVDFARSRRGRLSNRRMAGPRNPI